MRRGFYVAFGAVATLVASCLISIADTQPPATKMALPAGPSSTPAPADDTKTDSIQPSAKVLGFRSALFGASEADVRTAIAKDFGLPSSAIRKTQNLSDRTDVLTIRVPDVLAGGGSADVAYALGYRTKKLIQVSVIWSKESDKALTPERVLANCESLKDYFQAAGYEPKTIAVNSATRDGILLFRGADPEGHTTALMLHGATTPSQDKATQTFVPNALFLFYIADPKAPDVFKIAAGRF